MPECSWLQPNGRSGQLWKATWTYTTRLDPMKWTNRAVTDLPLWSVESPDTRVEQSVLDENMVRLPEAHSGERIGPPAAAPSPTFAFTGRKTEPVLHSELLLSRTARTVSIYVGCKLDAACSRECHLRSHRIDCQTALSIPRRFRVASYVQEESNSFLADRSMRLYETGIASPACAPRLSTSPFRYRPAGQLRC